jgi:thiol-disulfide isomerase/thioredoxin
MFSKASAVSLLCICFAAWKLATANAADDQGKKPAPDKSGMAAASDVVPAQHVAGAPGEADASDDATRAIYTQLEELLKARDAGNSVDFRPVADQIAKGLASKFDVEAFQLAEDAARVFEMAGAIDAAKLIYNAMKKSADSAEPPQLVAVAKETAAAGLKRVGLMGSTPKIQGTVFGGEKFDWAKYKGKVVLIDFWATWCGPCMRELPNVKKAYEKYHDKGFDVVGISLDEDKDALTEFLDKEKLPWKTLYEDDPAKHGFEGVKLAQEFGIDAIPATFLVDQHGKIVSIAARGEQLQSQLEQLLGKK